MNFANYTPFYPFFMVAGYKKAFCFGEKWEKKTLPAYWLAAKRADNQTGIFKVRHRHKLHQSLATARPSPVPVNPLPGTHLCYICFGWQNVLHFKLHFNRISTWNAIRHNSFSCICRWPANHLDMDNAPPTCNVPAQRLRFTWTQLPTARKSTLPLISAAPTDSRSTGESTVDTGQLSVEWLHWRTVQIMCIASVGPIAVHTHVKFVIL